MHLFILYTCHLIHMNYYLCIDLNTYYIPLFVCCLNHTALVGFPGLQYISGCA